MILNSFYYQIFCIFIISLLFGSFYNVVITRTLSNESIIYPPSKCPNCKKKLLWWHNIPVLSYLLLKGKCYFCKSNIDIQYPLVEIISSGIFLFLFLKYGITLKTIYSITILSLFLILAVMDIKKNVISTKFLFGIIIASILFNYPNLISSILGGIILGLCSFFIKKIFDKLFYKEVIGEGDIYLLFAFGTLIGINNIILYIPTLLLLQLIYCLPKFLNKIIKEKNNKTIYNLLWFIISYSILYLSKINAINLPQLLIILIIVNLIVSLFLVCKHLINNIKASKFSIIEPLSPSVFLSALIYLLLF